MTRDQDVTTLARGPAAEGVLSGAPTQVLRQIAALNGAREYSSGSLLFREGEPAEGIFLLCRGAVKLSVGCSHGDSLVLRSAGPGEILGLSATLTGQGHEVTAETTTPSQVVFVKRKDFLRYLREHKEVCLRVVESLSNDLQAAYERVRMLGLARIRHPHNN